ncbi:Holliday junction branch migration protein RuvA [Pinibacter aurantiacus]|uniref:Holliday junction branch migration complex subunit RuvA n=1 Tax=Pinibacter aurantiacus TaxID=2851599 RepID=A0A9E2SBN7_9BACT|nr:Holliday junction branch migration protein RuvA [Pinibacter aurantiacus]MBV4358154.1 Holliday junction branch migration protein RuvA [Pinibacter aurantiacus]
MIAYVKGDFVYKTPAVVHVDVHGVGYEVLISLNTFSSIEPLDKGLLHTFLHIREDAHVLYGFYEVAEKELFIQLISVSGVGASTARMMLSSMRPEEIVRAIVNGNAKQLEGIKGIGKKSAERIILELRDKLNKQSLSASVNILSTANNSLETDALNALVALGISRPNAELAVKKVLAAEPGSEKIEEIIKKALKTL